MAPLVLVINDIPKHGFVREKVFILNPILIDGPEVSRNIMLVLLRVVRVSIIII